MIQTPHPLNALESTPPPYDEDNVTLEATPTTEGVAVSSFEGTGMISHPEGGASACALATLNAVSALFDLERRGFSGLNLLEKIDDRDFHEVSTIGLGVSGRCSRHLDCRS
jgi:hypothetical protein